MVYRIHLFLKELILFVPTMLLGFFAAYRTLNYGYSVPGNSPGSGLQFGFTDLIILGTIVAFLIFFRKNAKVLSRSLKTLLMLVIFGGINAVLASFLSPLLSFPLSILAVILFYNLKSVLSHNIAIIVAIAGISAMLGISLLPKEGMLILIVLSFYDIFAVYKTGHMVKMAKAMLESGAVFGFVIPFRASGFFSDRVEAQANLGDKFMVLGSGDIALPCLFACSFIRYSLADAFIVGGFSIAGLLLTHLFFINQPERRPMAALPPIAMMSIIGYLVTVIF